MRTRDENRLIRLPRTLAVPVLGLALTVAAWAQEPSPDLSLVFTGSGKVSKTETTYTRTYKSKSKERETSMSSTRAKQPFSGSGAFELSGGKFARIKLPSDMLPLIRGGQDGWFTIDELFMNDREITGVVRINALNKLKLRIDRITGGITLNGSHGEFTGKCDRVDPEAKPKF